VREQVAKEPGATRRRSRSSLRRGRRHLALRRGRKVEREGFRAPVGTSEIEGAAPHVLRRGQTSKIPDVPEDTQVREIRKAASSARDHGRRHCDVLCQCGHSVMLVDTTQEALDRGIQKIKGNYAATVSKGRPHPARDGQAHGADPRLDHLGNVADADIVIEAVFERMDVKQDIFRKLDAIVQQGAILASNTSTLDVDKIAAVTTRPQEVIGTHFFSPANVMRLLEVVRGKQTAKDVLASTMKLGKALKKVAVVSGVCDGFIGNRMLEKYGQQSLFLLDEGASPQQVDGGARGMGHGDGPIHDVRHGGQRHRLGNPQAALSGTPGLRVFAHRRPHSASRAASARRPARASTGTSRAAASPFPDPAVDEIISSYRKELS